MNRNNKLEFNAEYWEDIEFLRIENLIEDKEANEQDFLSMEPPVDELDYLITKYELEMENIEVKTIFDPFEYEDYLIQLRDKKLIEDREKYEKDYFTIVDENLVMNDIFDFQISRLEEEQFFERNGYNYDFKYEPECYEEHCCDEYEDEMFDYLSYVNDNQFEAPSSCGCPYDDYMPNDDGLCDYLDCYDYPEGPNENLSGIKYY